MIGSSGCVIAVGASDDRYAIYNGGGSSLKHQSFSIARKARCDVTHGPALGNGHLVGTFAVGWGGAFGNTHHSIGDVLCPIIGHR
jgi:hypothetical protein